MTFSKSGVIISSSSIIIIIAIQGGTAGKPRLWRRGLKPTPGTVPPLHRRLDIKFPRTGLLRIRVAAVAVV